MIRNPARELLLAVLLMAGPGTAGSNQPAQGGEPQAAEAGRETVLRVNVGSRPRQLVEGLQPGPLRQRLAACAEGPFRTTDFSIGHRGAPLRYPEHTRESYVAAARQGAGIVECDVTFTRDRELVCRHSQCDLHTTTDILEIPELAGKCSQPFQAYDSGIIALITGSRRAATARCCTSDITLAEFRRLRGRIDRVDPRAATVAEYLRGDSSAERGTLMTHAESIRLFERLGVKMIPELKAPLVSMPFEGQFTRQMYAQKMIDEYREAGVDPAKVWPQSFALEDLEYWIANEPEFGRQAVYLDSRVYQEPGFEASAEDFAQLARRGVRLVAPPMSALLTLGPDGEIVPSDYARLARAAGLELLTWTFERSDLRDGAKETDFYYSTIAAAVRGEGDRYRVLDVLAREAKIRGIFSDWPATVTYYANCTGLD